MMSAGDGKAADTAAVATATIEAATVEAAARDGSADQQGRERLRRSLRSERFAGARLSGEAMFLMNRIGSLGSAVTNDYLRGHGLKVRHYSLLSLVCEAQAPTQREISDYLVLDPSQVVALVDDLEGQGLLRRETDPRDRRSKILVPTAAGREVLAEAVSQVDAAAAACLSALDGAEQEQLRGLLAKIAG